MQLTPTSLDWAMRTNGWSVAEVMLFLIGAFGGAVFQNPYILMGRIPRLKEIETARQYTLIRAGAASVAVIGLLASAAIFYGAY